MANIIPIKVKDTQVINGKTYVSLGEFVASEGDIIDSTYLPIDAQQHDPVTLSEVHNGLSLDVQKLALSTASTNTTGALTSTDWNTFNSKQSALPNASDTISGILTSTDWTIFNQKQNSLPIANTGHSGILSNTDWVTFNGKQNILSNASASVSGILTNTDWTTFNSKQAAITASTALSVSTLSTAGDITMGASDIVSSSRTISLSGRSSLSYDGSRTATLLKVSDISKHIVFDAGTLELMRLTGAGKLGIGTTTPAGRIDIIQAADTLNDGIRIANSAIGSYNRIWTDSGNQGRWDCGTTGQFNLIINGGGTGGISINETTPTALLHIKNNTLAEGKTYLNIYAATINIAKIDTDTGGNVRFKLYNSTGAAKFMFDSAGSSYVNGGNLGVNNTSPSYKLDVIGTARIGDASNHTSFEADGSLVMTGTATVFDDLPPFPLTMARTGVSAPLLATMIGTIKQMQFAVGNEVYGSTEVTHEYKQSSNIEVHVHWATGGNTNATAKYVKWEFEYTVANVDGTFGTPTTITSADFQSDQTAVVHKISTIGTITGTGILIGANIIWRLKRVASTGTAADTSPFGLGLGMHIEKDTLGSRQQYNK